MWIFGESCYEQTTKEPNVLVSVSKPKQAIP
ncbi:hypothetical protein SAMN05428987_5010 [Paenibacillus sp. CF095]|nr:hypothetical protein SAMN05428987_5010 [Paenibacillus sp. CF095]